MSKNWDGKGKQRYLQLITHYVHQNIPMLANMGPTARANAPSDLKIPITVPFWSCDPSFETKVIIHGTTIAVAEITHTHIR